MFFNFIVAFAAYERLHDHCRRRVRAAGEMMVVVFKMFVGALVMNIGITVILARRMLGRVVLR